VREVIFCVATEDDAAIEPIERAIAALSARGLRARWIATGARGPNRKVQQLDAVVRELATNELVVFADSDVDLTGFPLSELLEPLETSYEVGAVWAPPFESGRASTIGDAASHAVLGASLHAFPVLAEIDPSGLVGKLFAARVATLRSIGGLGELSDYLGEDMELARRLRERGLQPLATRTAARSLAEGRTLSSTARRYARWIAVVRAQRPHLLPTYPLFFFGTLPFVLLALALAVSGIVGVAAAASSALFVSTTRLLVARIAHHRTGRNCSLPRLAARALMADAVMAAAWLLALSSRNFEWRGLPLAIEPGGRLVARTGP
jgi:ceramide glucosyltransferase